jgi:hypothetical protein
MRYLVRNPQGRVMGRIRERARLTVPTDSDKRIDN